MHRGKAIGLLLLLLLVGSMGVLGWLTYRQVQQFRLDRALIAAIKRSDTPAALFLLSQGADPNARDEPNVKPPPIWKLLFDRLHGQHPKPSVAPTALYLVFRRHSRANGVLPPPVENVVLVKALLDRGADANAKTQSGRTPLMDAAGNGMYTCASLLLEHGADVNADDQEIEGTPLMIAVFREDARMVALLVNKGANVNTRTLGETALMVAAINEKSEIVPFLLAHGAQVNARADEDGRTALMTAAEGRTNTVKLLLANGADVNARDNEGNTALRHAKLQGQTAIVHLLKQAGTKE
jgi:ankyrin repeat protein